MSAIEFIANAGKSFSVQLYNASSGVPIGTAITPVTDSVPTRYRASTGSQTGIVYVVATATNLRVSGYADLDSPGDGGYSRLVDSLEALQAGEVNVTVLPGSIQQQMRSKKSTLVLYVGETILTSHIVLDANGDPIDMTGRNVRLYIEDMRKNPIADFVPTINTSTISGTVPSSVTQYATRPMIWALRDKAVGAGNALIADGNVEVQYAPGG